MNVAISTCGLVTGHTRLHDVLHVLHDLNVFSMSTSLFS